jgi:hypothetical protein
MEQSNDTDIMNSFHYYNEQLPGEYKEIIEHYKAEMDPDDWEDNPLKISYIVINWLLKNKLGSLSYSPELIKTGVLTKEQLFDQVSNAELLTNILSSFPRVTNREGVNVYRGKTCENIKDLAIGKQVTMYNFLSTSTNLDVATRFSQVGENPCLMRINIPVGNPLPFINLTMDTRQSESEVLLPAGSTFKLMNKSQVDINGRIHNLYDFILIRFGSIETRHFWGNYMKLAEKLYNEYGNTEPLDMDSGGGRKSKRSRSKNKRSKRSRSKRSRNKNKRSKSMRSKSMRSKSMRSKSMRSKSMRSKSMRRRRNATKSKRTKRNKYKL